VGADEGRDSEGREKEVMVNGLHNKNWVLLALK
jgi:hypothetical protein